MENNFKNIIKIVLIIAIIFVLVAQILPWRGFSINVPNVANVGIDFYDWGSHIYMSSSMEIPGFSGSTMDVWSLFYLVNFGTPDLDTSGTDTSFISSSASTYNILPTMLLILSFIFCLVAIFVGIGAIIKLNQKKYNVSLFAGVISLIAIILFVAGISLAFSSINEMVNISSMFNYTYGFYFMIIATILFFVAFAISKIVKESPTEEIPTAINNMSMQSASQQFDKPNFPE